jgi:hypothetical protein
MRQTIIFAPYLILILTTMKELIEKINAEFEAFSKEAEQQAEKGNKAAGTRARKSALELSKLFKDFRKVSVEESKK